MYSQYNNNMVIKIENKILFIKKKKTTDSCSNLKTPTLFQGKGLE
jgi:hypothetical protein